MYVVWRGVLNRKCVFKPVPFEDMEVLDQHILLRLEALQIEVAKHYDEYNFVRV